MKQIFTTIKQRVLRGKTLVISSILLSSILGAVLLEMAIPQTAEAEPVSAKAYSPTIVKNGHLTLCKLDKGSYEVVKKVKMVITAYSSTESQTDSTPFITASGKNVADGIIANNMFPFGTKIRIPELYGDKVFIVEDRMNKRKGLYHADIWFPEYSQAKNFGAKVSYIEVLEN